MKYIIIVLCFIIFGLIVYIFYPKTMRLVGTSDTVVVKDGFNTFEFYPPIPLHEGVYFLRPVIIEGEKLLCTMEIYMSKKAWEGK